MRAERRAAGDTGERRVLDFADRLRRLGPGSVEAGRLRREAYAAWERGEVSIDRVSPLFRHACIHAGAIARRGGERFRVCPVCEVTLDAADEGDVS